MVALVNGAEKMSTTKHKQLQVHLNAVWQARSTWTNADRHNVIEGL
jgi:hypothetical protein